MAGASLARAARVLYYSVALADVRHGCGHVRDLARCIARGATHGSADPACLVPARPLHLGAWATTTQRRLLWPSHR